MVHFRVGCMKSAQEDSQVTLEKNNNNVSSGERKRACCRLAYRGSVTQPGYVVVLWDESVGVGVGLLCLG